MLEKPSGKLRTGFTTGTSATAASIAAILSIINQKKIETVDVLLPKKERIKIHINSNEFGKNNASCSVIKDGGDDPDVTHGAEIVVNLELTSKPTIIEIDGGEGVGRVTKPGIGLEIGQAAINLLGTSGIVIPYSTASFAAAIRQQIDVVVSMGADTVVLTTGGRSEDYARKILELPEHSFIQMGDFSGYTISQCAKKDIKKAYIGGFIGKFAKMATGVKQTHVKGSKVNMEFLSILAKKCKAEETVIQEIKNANTARNVQEIILKNNIEGFFDEICSEVYKQMQIHSENKTLIEIILFDFDGNVLAHHPKQ